MLNKEQIRKNLQENPFWEPEEKAPQGVWNTYYEVYQDMVETGEIDLEDEFEDELLDSDEPEDKSKKKNLDEF